MSKKTKQVFYCIREVAEILDVSERTIRRYIKDGKLGNHRIGHQYRISQTDLEGYLSAAYNGSDRGFL